MAGKPDESDDDYSSPAPPQRRARPELHLPHRREDSDASAGHLSPPASPSIPMSLCSLGSPLSPLLRQDSPHTQPPSSPLYPQSDPDRIGTDREDHYDTTQDSRDVLVQRLNDLVAILSQQHHMNGGNINALHAKVDELENVLHMRDGDQNESDLSLEPPHLDNLLPSDLSSLGSPTRPSPSAKTRRGHQTDKKRKSRAAKMTIAEAEQVIAEAQSLHKSLEVVISNLRDRQEETEHIHALLITRLERAAQRIIYLEERIKDLEREQKESDTELLNLQIQLKAIEVQCMSYVPQGADQELSESISTWKREYSALKQRRARNKERVGSTNSTPTARRVAPPSNYL
ncbi:hypothetical protein GQX73_g7064 [Xylaria multiplex]|uniref:Uncharacterized protein n=1 Tax=Xylaria multiplex TaxID=323545 RepID=A0A7C8ILJ4_9PEZI|nr:hypothetical protein GQX73_g7064 [Xylaria multiplex]